MIQRLLGWVGIAAYAALVFEMLRLWTSPQLGDADRILTLAVLMGFEFVMVHSGVFMAAFPRKISLLVFVPFYGVFALAFNAMVPGNEILYLYMGVVFIRMRFAFSNPSEEATGRHIGMSAITVMLYFFLMMGFAFGSSLIPQFGLTPQYLLESGYMKHDVVGGIFTEMPQVPMAMGIVYFSLLALIEIMLYGLLSPFKNSRRIDAP